MSLAFMTSNADAASSMLLTFVYLNLDLSLRCDAEIAVGIAHGKGRQQALANTHTINIAVSKTSKRQAKEKLDRVHNMRQSVQAHVILKPLISMKNPVSAMGNHLVQSQYAAGCKTRN